MTNTKHTPEPLPVHIGLADKQCCDCCGSPACRKTWLTIGNYYQGSGFAPDEADRLIACWNACAGMTDPEAEIEALRDSLRPNGYFRAEIATLKDEAERLREMHKAQIADIAILRETVAELRNAAEYAITALEHSAPNDCWATGPLTGDGIADLVVCPGCSGIAKLNEAIAKANEVLK